MVVHVHVHVVAYLLCMVAIRCTYFVYVLLYVNAMLSCMFMHLLPVCLVCVC